MKLGKIPGWLGLILIVSYVGITFMLIFATIPAESMELVDRMIGLIGTLTGVAAGYHFKNSENIVEKTDSPQN